MHSKMTSNNYFLTLHLKTDESSYLHKGRNQQNKKKCLILVKSSGGLRYPDIIFPGLCDKTSGELFTELEQAFFAGMAGFQCLSTTHVCDTDLQSHTTDRI